MKQKEKAKEKKHSGALRQGSLYSSVSPASSDADPNASSTSISSSPVA